MMFVMPHNYDTVSNSVVRPFLTVNIDQTISTFDVNTITSLQYNSSLDLFLYMCANYSRKFYLFIIFGKLKANIYLHFKHKLLKLD